MGSVARGYSAVSGPAPRPGTKRSSVSQSAPIANAVPTMDVARMPGPGAASSKKSRVGGAASARR